MYAGSTRAIYMQGTIMMTANNILNIRDSSVAILRRIRPFKISKAPQKKLHLLSKDQKGGWSGALAPELPGILAQVVSVTKEEVNK